MLLTPELRQRFDTIRQSKWAILIAFIANVILASVCAYLTVQGLSEKIDQTTLIPFAFVYLYFCSDRRIFWYILFPVSIVFGAYYIVGAEYGPPSYQFISSLLATNTAEAGEFFSTIPVINFFLAPCIPLSAVACYYISKYFLIKPWRNKIVVLLTIATVIVFCAPIKFVEKLASSVQATGEEIDALNNFPVDNHWPKDTVLINPKAPPRDYVLVIGESQRRDYMHAYGYPIPNTPFIDKAPFTVVEGLYSANFYTIGSLRLMLTRGNYKKREPNYSLNFIDMAKRAGIDTYWLSNQGFIGTWDTPVSALANRADHVIFLNRQSYLDANYSDYMLIPKFHETLNEPAKKNRLFVLHTIGAHPNACARLKDVPDQYKVTESAVKYSYIACYLSAVLKTDRFLEKAYNELAAHYKETGRPFSMIYFADHGQSHHSINGILQVNNVHVGKLHYNVPLLRIDSESKTHRKLVSRKSGVHFIEGLASWMGIKSSKLKPSNLFDGKNDANDYGLLNDIELIKYAVDPAIDIRPYLFKESTSTDASSNN